MGSLMRITACALALTLSLTFAVAVESVLGNVNTVLRLHKSFDAVSYNSQALAEFEAEVVANIATALDTDASRVVIDAVREGSEESPALPQFGDRRRRTVEPYRGKTLLVHITITEGSPSSLQLYEKMKDLVQNPESAWYLGTETAQTDPGTVPPHKMQQSTDEALPGRLPPSLIIPIGAAPLGFMFTVYILMTWRSKREQPDKHDKKKVESKGD